MCEVCRGWSWRCVRCVESGAVRCVELCRGWSCEMCGGDLQMTKLPTAQDAFPSTRPHQLWDMSYLVYIPLLSGKPFS